MKISGIYKIQSIKKPNKIYIGSAKRIDMRWYIHLCELRKDKHNNKKLQNHFNKYGESDLQFSILLGCNIEDLIKTEQYFLDSYNPYFNICKTAGNQLGAKRTEEQRKRMSESHKGILLTEEHKRNIGKSNIGKKRPKISEETRHKMSNASKLRKSTLDKHWKLTPEQCEYRKECMMKVWVKRKTA